MGQTLEKQHFPKEVDGKKKGFLRDNELIQPVGKEQEVKKYYRRNFFFLGENLSLWALSSIM